MSAPIAPEFRDPVMPWRLLEAYRPLAGVYDEMSSGAGQPRAHCAALSSRSRDWDAASCRRGGKAPNGRFARMA